MLNLFKKRKVAKQLEYLKEMRPLPLGVKEFEAWSLEIIRLADIPGLTIESGQFALSEMVLHVKPTQSFESYGHFVHSLRKGAANQIAHSIFQDLKKARTARDEAEKASISEKKVLANPKV